MKRITVVCALSTLFFLWPYFSSAHFLTSKQFETKHVVVIPRAYSGDDLTKDPYYYGIYDGNQLHPNRPSQLKTKMLKRTNSNIQILEEPPKSNWHWLWIGLLALFIFLSVFRIFPFRCSHRK